MNAKKPKISRSKRRYYWQIHTRENGVEGTAYHAFPARLVSDTRSLSTWVPLCGRGHFPVHFCVVFADLVTGNEKPIGLPICKQCSDLVATAQGGF